MTESRSNDLFGWLAEHRDALRRVVALTGAGMSAESGVPTFRGDERFWRGLDPADLFTPQALVEHPLLAWQLYDELRVRIATTEPNPGHHALAALAGHRGVTLATQNIDGLHQRAGSSDVLELHGSLWYLRCTGCRFSAEDRRAPLPDMPPRCPQCGAFLRPDIVLFTEPLPIPIWQEAVQAVEACDLMLVIGTSGVVYPAAGLPSVARAHGAKVVEVNPGETALSGEVDFVCRATAADALPRIARALHSE